MRSLAVFAATLVLAGPALAAALPVTLLVPADDPRLERARIERARIPGPRIEPAPTVTTGFESSSSASFPLRFLAGFEAWVDTSEAGFLGPPEYFCRIDGERVFDLADMGDFDHALFALDGLVHIAEPTPDGFLARVMVFFLGFVSGHSAPFAAFESETTMATSFGMLDVEKGKVSLPWNVVWMGVEG